MNFQDWVGRSATGEDRVDQVRIAGLAALLDRRLDDDLLPPGFHWVLFPPVPPPSQLAPDGQIEGGLLPIPAGRRRMWAGGRLQFLRPLRLDQPVRRVSTVRHAEEKRGQGGSLLFVTVEHLVEGPEGPALIELHDIVYREAGALAAAPPPSAAAIAVAGSREHRIDDLSLFRYSALTGNPYRIHWDRGWTDAQGLPGLLLHGSYAATLLLSLLDLVAPGRRLAEFSYRALAPVSDGVRVRAEAEAAAAADRMALRLVADPGVVAMRGDARFAERDGEPGQAGHA